MTIVNGIHHSVGELFPPTVLLLHSTQKESAAAPAIRTVDTPAGVAAIASENGRRLLADNPLTNQVV